MATLCLPSRIRWRSPSRPRPMITGYGGSTWTSTVTGSVMVTRLLCGKRGRRRRRIGTGRRRQRRRGAPPRGPTAPSLLTRRIRILEALDDVAHHRPRVTAVGVHPERRDPPVQRNALGHQRLVLLASVRPGQ